MYRSAWIAGLVALAFFSTAPAAEASKIAVRFGPTYEGFEHLKEPNLGYEYSDYYYLNSYGWSPYATTAAGGTLPSVTVERDWQASNFVHADSSPQSLDAPLKYDVTVMYYSDPDENGSSLGLTVAEGKLAGTATGEIKHSHMTPYYLASGSGSATVKELDVIDPSRIPDWASDLRIPDWLPNLRVDLEIKPVDGKPGIYTTVLTAGAPSPVPEPGTLAVFLAAAGAGMLIHRRRRDRAVAA